LIIRIILLTHQRHLQKSQLQAHNALHHHACILGDLS
jgi:hypothetical protein